MRLTKYHTGFCLNTGFAGEPGNDIGHAFRAIFNPAVCLNLFGCNLAQILGFRENRIQIYLFRLTGFHSRFSGTCGFGSIFSRTFGRRNGFNSRGCRISFLVSCIAFCIHDSTVQFIQIVVIFVYRQWLFLVIGHGETPLFYQRIGYYFLL